MLSIPKTSPTKYVSSIVALNIHSDNGTGDWHTSDVLWTPDSIAEDVFIVGDGQRTNTIPLVGITGVSDKSDVLEKMGFLSLRAPVYAADHARACFDLIYQTVIIKNNINFVRLDDWFPSFEDKKSVYNLLELAEPKLTLEQRERLESWKIKNPLEVR